MSLVDTTTGEILEIKSIPIGLIENGPAVRTELLDDAHAQALQENIDSLPNIKVRIAGDRYQLIDGRHRLAAHKFAHRDTITAEVYDLDDREHWLMAVEANTKHGRGLSLTERRRNAQRTIELAPDLPNREIARRCGLSPTTVGKLRPETAGVHYGHPATGQNDHADRAGEAETGDGSDRVVVAPSPAQPSSDDGGVSVSESAEPASPADSIPAPSSGHLEDPAGESSTGEDEGTAHDPSSPLLDEAPARDEAAEVLALIERSVVLLATGEAATQPRYETGIWEVALTFIANHPQIEARVLSDVAVAALRTQSIEFTREMQ